MTKGHAPAGHKLRLQLIMHRSRMPTATTSAYVRRGFFEPDPVRSSTTQPGHQQRHQQRRRSSSSSASTTKASASIMKMQTDNNAPASRDKPSNSDEPENANAQLLGAPLRSSASSSSLLSMLETPTSLSHADSEYKSKSKVHNTLQQIRTDAIHTKPRVNQKPEMARYDTNDFNVRMYLTAPPSRRVYVQVEFELAGSVHGVYFTRYAKEMSQQLGIRGWIRFTRRGTIEGQVEGEKDKIDEMALWLKLQGSPGSRIEHCKFKRWQIIDSYSFRDFSIRF